MRAGVSQSHLGVTGMLRVDYEIKSLVYQRQGSTTLTCLSLELAAMVPSEWVTPRGDSPFSASSLVYLAEPSIVTGEMEGVLLLDDDGGALVWRFFSHTRAEPPRSLVGDKWGIEMVWGLPGGLDTSRQAPKAHVRLSRNS